MNSKYGLIKHLISTGTIHSSNIIEAFESIDSVDFALDPNASDVYEDYPLSIGYGQTISQPTTVAMMLEMLEPKEGDSILDIGSGSGWSTAILSYIVGKDGSVIGRERIKELVKFGNYNLEKYKFQMAKIIQARDTLGIIGEKFDRILVSGLFL
ncbi:MAG: protein-L-isoaspartate(D-aspartate) O-methyltransferase [Sulfurimonas sp.]|jgi:protein-L-isoaspartate(D-aspartate) O-methyltransferase|uniref:L-isoaspartyl protein carboxyl methyltransferase n=1 Tax=Sulfurimonas sp. TaxID=2022749 RepID=UPI0039E22A19